MKKWELFRPMILRQMLLCALLYFIFSTVFLNSVTAMRAQAAASLSVTPVSADEIDSASQSAMTPEMKSLAAAGMQLIRNGSGHYADAETAALVWQASYNAALDNTASERLSFRKGSDGHYDLTLRGYSEDRQAVINAVVSGFGIYNDGDRTVLSDSAAIIGETSRRVAASMKYDAAYRYASMSEALTAGRGVCQHYSIIACILLNAEGIPTRRARGILTVRRADGTIVKGTHSWNLCCLNGTWVPVDFTPYSNGQPNAGLVPADHYADYQEELTANIFLEAASGN